MTIVEDTLPLVFNVVVRNMSKEDVSLESCEAEILTMKMLGASGKLDRLPGKFRYHLEFSNGNNEVIKRKKESSVAITVPVAFHWDLSVDPPDMIAVCKAVITFRLGGDSSPQKTEEVMFVVPSSLPAMDNVLADLSVKDPAVRKLKKELSEFSGFASPGIRKLLKAL